MADEVIVSLNSFEQRLMVAGLNEWRNELLRQSRPTDDIDELLIRVIDAPRKKSRSWGAREER